MSRWLPAIAAAIACVAILPSAKHAGAGELFPWQNVASESYYQLNVERGDITASVHVLVQPGDGDLDAVWLWLMPGATDIKVMEGDTELEHEITAGPEPGDPQVVIATLPATLKGKLTADLEMTYTVPAQDNAFARVAPGAIEIAMVSQGAGSFVFVDVPQDANNVIDPGCVKAKSQPGSVRDAGLERWVCGEALAAALSTDDQDTLDRCAALDDRCRQRLVDTPFSAFAQSVTDPSLIQVLDGSVEMSEGPLDVELQYFREDSAWATQQFAYARTSLPLLEALFGYPYQYDSALLRESHHLDLAGFAGVAFNGQMLLSQNSPVDDEVTVHELAHQWAGLNLETNWMWEGLAEWATQTIGPSVGITLRDWGWAESGYTDPLATWYNGSAVTDPNYWYGKAAAFWHAYEDAIGGRENMTAVLAQMGAPDAPDPITARWFMDRGEEVSGANLDALFLEWVWVPDYATSELATRRTAHDLVDGLKERAAAVGLVGVPADIQSTLDSWSFKSISDRVVRADKLVAKYQAVREKETAAGLAPSSAVPEAWDSYTLSQIEQLIDQQGNVIDSIGGALRTIADEPEDSSAWDHIAEAKAAYAAGDFEEAARLSSEAGAVIYNEVASTRMIAVAEATGADFQENFFKHIGLLFEDPEGDLAAAKAASTAGNDAEALALAQSAYDTWTGAQTRGLQRLAILAALMSALTFGGWWLLGRVTSPKDEISILRARDALSGSAVETPRTWRDWENNNNS